MTWVGAEAFVSSAVFPPKKEMSAGSDAISPPTTMAMITEPTVLPRQAMMIADKAYVLVQGANAHTGTGTELMQNDEVRRTFLGG